VVCGGKGGNRLITGGVSRAAADSRSPADPSGHPSLLAEAQGRTRSGSRACKSRGMPPKEAIIPLKKGSHYAGSGPAQGSDVNKRKKNKKGRALGSAVPLVPHVEVVRSIIRRRAPPASGEG